MKSDILVLLAAAFLGSGAVFAKMLSTNWEPLELATFSLLAGFIILSIHNYSTKTLFFKGLRLKKHFIPIVSISCLGTAVALWLVLSGLTSIDASSAGFLLQMDCVASVVLGVIILNERISKAQWIGILIAFSGSIFLSITNPGHILNMSSGSIKVAAGGMLFGLALVANKVLAVDFKPLQVAWFRVAGAVPVLIFALLSQNGGIGMSGIFAKVDLTWFIYVVTNFYLSYLFISMALQKGNVWKVAVYLRTIPLFTLLGSLFWLHEKPDIRTGVGALMILTGIIIVDAANIKVKAIRINA